MPIKWSPLKVSEAMDEVEGQVALAESFFAEAKTKAEAAKKIPNLPQYMEQRIQSLIWDIERIDKVKGAIETIRQDIPKGAIVAEEYRGRHGSQQSMV